MTLSGIHVRVVHLITNKDPISGDIAACYSGFDVVNGVLVRVFVGVEGVFVWGGWIW